MIAVKGVPVKKVWTREQRESYIETHIVEICQELSGPWVGFRYGGGRYDELCRASGLLQGYADSGASQKQVRKMDALFDEIDESIEQCAVEYVAKSKPMLPSVKETILRGMSEYRKNHPNALSEEVWQGMLESVKREMG